MELTKRDNTVAKGVAIIGMLMLHLFCQKDDIPFLPLLWVKDIPIVYFLGLFGDGCLSIFCFVSGYAYAKINDTSCKQLRNKQRKHILVFLINYWVMLLVFTALAVLCGRKSIPGSLSTFLGNFFLYGISYCGAWWYVLTYVIMIYVSPFLLKSVKNHNSIIVFFLSGIVYFLTYIFRFNLELNILNGHLAWIWKQILLLGNTQFPFVVGALNYKHNIVSKLRSWKFSKKGKCLLAIVIIGVLFCVRCVITSFILAPLSGLLSMTCIWVCLTSEKVIKPLEFLGKHSMNIWFVHMFYYLVLFPGLAYKAVYPVFVFLFLVILCLITSVLITPIQKAALKLIRID